MITKEIAFELAKIFVPDIEERRYKIFEGPKEAGGAIFRSNNGDYDNSFYVVYSPTTKIEDLTDLTICSSDVLVIEKDYGKLLYQGSLGDEG